MESQKISTRCKLRMRTCLQPLALAFAVELRIAHCSAHDQDLRTAILDCHQIHLKN